MYEDVTYDDILERMLDRVPDKFDKREGSVIWDTHSPTAIELQTLYLELDTILSESYGDTASREYLILRCAERGITPYEAAYAVLQGEFTPTDIDVTGQRFSIDDLNYVVTEKISDGVYKVQCETAGTAGNQNLGTMIPIDYIDGLETAELTAVLIPGEDEEDTEELRQRYFDSFDEKSFGGNVSDYLNTVNAISGVGGTKVERVWNGDISPTDMIPSDTVTVWYESVIGSLDEEAAAWLTSVYTAALTKKLATGGTVLVTIINSEYDAASDTLVDTVQETLDPEQNAGEGYGLAPIGHVVTVQSVGEATVDISAELTLQDGYTQDDVQDSITEAVEDYLLGLRTQWANTDSLTVRISQIESNILSIDRVIDISGTTINGEESNFVAGSSEIPVLGEVSLNEGS